MDAEAPILLSVDQTVALLLAEAEAERAVADPTAPDPCAWVGSSRGWVDDLIKRPLNPLPVHVRGKGHRGGGHRLHPGAVRQWFAEEFERRNAPPTPDAIIASPDTGILLTASALARELGMHPQTLTRRLRDYRVEPRRQTAGVTWYRLSDMLGALTAAAKAEDPSTLPPQDRDAHWRAEAREDEVRKSRRELIPVGEALGLMNTLAGALRDFYDLIPDTLEGKCGLGPEALALVERELDDARRANAAQLREIQAQLTGAAAVSQEPEEPEALPDFDLEAA